MPDLAELTAQEEYAQIRAALTPEERAELDMLLAWEPPPKVTLHDLVIQDERGNLVPLTWNPAQRIILEELGIDPDEPCPDISGLCWRKRILKARRTGITTALMALYFLDTYNNNERLTVSMAHNQDSAEGIFEIVHRFYRFLPREKYKKAARANVREFYWTEQHSRFIVTTANQRNALSGLTVNNLHKSEYAKWEGRVEEIKSLDASLNIAARWGNIVEETTAFGLNHFYHSWQSSNRDDTPYKSIFLPWFRDPRNVADVPSGMALTEQERDNKEVFGLRMEQIAWYREAQREHGDLVSQEYPYSPSEAFLSTGNARFRRPFLQSYLDHMYPAGKYAITYAEDGSIDTNWNPIRIEINSWMGVLTTYRDPDPDHRYIILADTAKGLNPGGIADFSVAHIWDLEDAEQVGHYRGQMVEQDFATDLYTLGMMYNRALIVVETPGPGEAVLSYLGTTREGQSQAYPHIYHHRDDDVFNQRTGLRTLKEPGWKCTHTSRPEADAKLASMLKDAEDDLTGAILIRDPNTIEELIHYIYVTRDRCEAEAGAHDDEVSCMRMLAMVWGQYTTRGKTQLRQLTPAKPKAFTGSQGGRR